MSSLSIYTRPDQRVDLGTKLNNYYRCLFNFKSKFSVWTFRRVCFQHFSFLQFKLFLKESFLATQRSFWESQRDQNQAYKSLNTRFILLLSLITINSFVFSTTLAHVYRTVYWINISLLLPIYLVFIWKA